MAGQYRTGLQLFGGADEASWHILPAGSSYRLAEGGPVSISLCHDGRIAEGFRLTRSGDLLEVGPGTLRAISCLGSAALLQVTLKPDARLTDRRLMPDDWYPEG